jgi:hypothetical protein
MTRYLDVLGRSFTVPDPGDLASLSASYRAVCVNIEDAKGQLGALRSPQAWAEWTGLAADAFARSIGRLPGQLDQAWQSYNTAAWALSEYASGLGPVVAALSALAYQAEEAQGHLTAVTAAREQVIQQGQDPGTTGWNARQQDAQAAVDELRSRLSSLVHEMNSLSGECVARIRQAQHEGIQNEPVSVFDDVLSAVGDVWHDAGQVIKVAGDVLDDLFVQPLVNDVRNMERTGWSWENIGKTLGDIGFDLGVTVLVAGLFISGVGEAAAPFLIGLGVLTTGAKGMAAAEDEQGASWGEVASSAFFDVGLPLAGGALHAAVDADSNYLTDAFDQGDLDQMEQLKDGTDARVSAGALWNTGVRHVFNLDEAFSGLSVTNPIDASRDGLSSALTVDDGLTHGPAAKAFEYLKPLAEGLSRAHDAKHAWQLAEGQDM